MPFDRLRSLACGCLSDWNPAGKGLTVHSLRRTVSIGLLAAATTVCFGGCAQNGGIIDEFADALYGDCVLARALCDIDSREPAGRSSPSIEELVGRNKPRVVPAAPESAEKCRNCFADTPCPNDPCPGLRVFQQAGRRIVRRSSSQECLEIGYEPPRPPKFLTVPVRPVFSTVNMDAPTPRRGDVEVGFGGAQLDFPSHD